MLETLNNIRFTSDILGASLDQYVALCSALEFQAHAIPKSLSYLIDSELVVLNSIEMRIRKARSALGRTRNYSSNLVPVNNLPAEILSRIFTLVLAASRRDYEKHKSTAQHGPPKYPDVFLHVCSRWRRIATTSPRLWSHIDIIPRYLPNTRLLTRAEALADLAGQLPLNLHITGAIEQGLDGDYYPNSKIPPFPCCSAIAPRIQSLELVTHVFSWFHLAILEVCFVNCTPGTLTHLVIQMPRYLRSSEFRSGFIEAKENASEPGSLHVDMQQDQLEALWFPIKFLYLCGIYPRWSSKAYYGLVELRLLALQIETPITITEAQLVGILESSPQLRVFHFAMTIEESLPNDASITPVYLDSLEVLDLSEMPPEQNGTILRWLETGSHPLTVALGFTFPDELLSDDETRRFFARSRTTKLAVTSPDEEDWPPELLSLSPHLDILAFQSVSLYTEPNPTPFPEEHIPPPISFRRNHLHLIFDHSGIDLGWLLELLKRWPVRMITIRGDYTTRNGQSITRNELEHELLEICPVVRILDADGPSPTMDWHLIY